ncbi:MAG: 6,7-dimethyl-8-ribityllumazine synthase [Actinobacteria bacterium]|nr:6,7-dimethyl-8-ribityllumazine synthase [Actinomycetota bacterium]
MSGSGRPAGVIDGRGISLAIVTASWHEEICGNLRSQALAAAADCGAICSVDVRVPGALELAVVAQAAARRDAVDAVVALGVVIRGGTPHFEYVCTTSSDALSQVALNSGVPVANGVLTCDTFEQAYDRDGRDGAAENKGYDAALAAIATALTLRGL